MCCYHIKIFLKLGQGHRVVLVKLGPYWSFKKVGSNLTFYKNLVTTLNFLKFEKNNLFIKTKK